MFNEVRLFLHHSATWSGALQFSVRKALGDIGMGQFYKPLRTVLNISDKDIRSIIIIINISIQFKVIGGSKLGARDEPHRGLNFFTFMEF